MTRFGEMKHLGILEEAHLVVVRRAGFRSKATISIPPIQHIYERWVGKYRGHVSAQR